jgi:hypothetical protein
MKSCLLLFNHFGMPTLQNSTKFSSSISTPSSRSESESYITTDGQSASLSWNKAPIWGLRPDFYYCQTVAGLLMWGALSDERTGLSFTIAAGPRQRNHSRVRVRDHILLSQIRDFLFHRLLRLAGLRWRYSTPPPHESQSESEYVTTDGQSVLE